MVLHVQHCRSTLGSAKKDQENWSYKAMSPSILSKAIQLCVEDDFVSDGLVCKNCKTSSLKGMKFRQTTPQGFQSRLLFWRLKTSQRHAKVDEVVGSKTQDAPLLGGLSRLGRSYFFCLSRLLDASGDRTQQNFLSSEITTPRYSGTLRYS